MAEELVSDDAASATHTAVVDQDDEGEGLVGEAVDSSKVEVEAKGEGGGAWHRRRGRGRGRGLFERGRS